MRIDRKKLYEIYRAKTWYKGTDYKVMEDTIYASDPEDGGADHTIIIKDLSTDKYYEGDYTDWDLDNLGEDLEEELIEVFPVEKTIIVYERNKK